MFRHRPSLTRYGDRETKFRLSWLAQQMTQHSLTVFYIEWLRPDWLEKRWQQRTIHIGTGLIIGLLCGLPVWLLFGLDIDGLRLGLSSGTVGWFIAFNRFNSDIPAEVLRWSWPDARPTAEINLGLFLVPIITLSPILIIWPFFESFFVRGWLLFGLCFGLSMSLICWLITYLSNGLITETINTRTIPNEGISRALRNALYSFLIYGLPCGMIAGFGGGIFSGLVGGIEELTNPLLRYFRDDMVSDGLTGGLKYGLKYGLIGGLIGAASKGGGLCLQHSLLRLMLVRNKVAPWNYIDFLDYAADRILLHRVGGGYIFIHRYLLEYFATLKTEAEERYQGNSSAF